MARARIIEMKSFAAEAAYWVEIGNKERALEALNEIKRLEYT